MADGRKNNRPVNGLKPGQSGNSAGSKLKVRVTKSKLNSLSEALRNMEGKALENIRNSVEGKEVNAESLNSSKWVVSSLVTVDKAILSEEVAKTKLKMDLLEVNTPDEQTPEQIGQEVKPRLSLVFQAPEDEE